MMVDNAGLGIGGKRELAHLDLMAGLLGLGFRESYTGDLGFAIGAAGNAVLIDRLGWLSRDARYRDNAAHAGHVRQLWQAGDDVPDCLDALFAGLHPFIHVD